MFLDSSLMNLDDISMIFIKPPMTSTADQSQAAELAPSGPGEAGRGTYLTRWYRWLTVRDEHVVFLHHIFIYIILHMISTDFIFRY